MTLVELYRDFKKKQRALLLHEGSYAVFGGGDRTYVTPNPFDFVKHGWIREKLSAQFGGMYPELIPLWNAAYDAAELVVIARREGMGAAILRKLSRDNS